MKEESATLLTKTQADTSKHERLRLYLLTEIQEGRLQPGDPLPTEHELAALAAISRNTVRQALASLEYLGLIYRVRGRGTFVHAAALQRLKSEPATSALEAFALVIPELRGGYYPSLQRGFGDAAAGLHHQMLVCDTGNDLYRQADALLQLLDKKVAGLAIVPTSSRPTPPHQLRPLRECGIPMVFCHRPVEGIAAPLVSFSGLEVGRTAALALLAQGHRRAAYFTPSLTGMGAVYEQGFREVFTPPGIVQSVDWIRDDEITLPHAEQEKRVQAHLDNILQQPTPPTAIFCSFDTVAELLYLLLTQRGLRIPQDISLIGFGGTWREGGLMSRLVSVAVDEEALGRQALHLLQEMRLGQRPLDDESVTLLPLQLSAGETLGPAPTSTS